MRVVSVLRVSVVALMIGAVWAAAPTPASALYSRSSLQVDVGLFYDDLSPHGDWIEDGGYGWVWVPRVSSGWRPYTHGRWVWTDEYGWLWVSDEEFGWATYHYGRWYYDPGYGWAWVPGYDWGPSWCSFRYGGDYIGWAPLPPRVPWQVGLGFRVGGVNIDAFIQPNYYTFVPAHAFVDPSPWRHAVPVARNTTIINITKNVTNYTTVQNRVVNRSFRVDEVERVARKAVPRVKAVEVTSVGAVRKAKIKDNEIPVFRPQVREAKTKVPPRGKPLERREAATDKPQTHDGDDRGRVADPDKQRATDQRESQEKRAAEAKREAESRQQLEKQRQDDQRAQKERADAAKREADARREIDRKREADQQAADKKRAEQRELDKRREDAAKREADARRELEKRRATEQQERDRVAARQREDKERQREQLEKRQAHERTDLERAHRNEIKTPARSDVDRTHEREHAAMEERQHREKQQLQSRQQQSQQAREEPKQKEKGKPKPKPTPSHKPNDKS